MNTDPDEENDDDGIDPDYILDDEEWSYEADQAAQEAEEDENAA